MALQIEPRTRADLLALPDDGCRHELIDGEYVVTPAPGMPHQVVLAALFSELSWHVRTHRLGLALCSPADLAFGQDEVLQPDLFVVPPMATTDYRWERVSSLLLVVEIVSPSSGLTDRERKRLRYQRAGVPYYWIVDPELRQVEVWQPETTVGTVTRDTLVWPVPPDAPLVIDVASIFPAA